MVFEGDKGMSDPGIIVALAFAAVLAVVLYVFAWRASAGASALIKGLVRYGVPAVVLVVGAIAILMPQLQHAKTAATPDGTDRFEYRSQKPKAKPRKRAQDQERKAGEAARRREQEEAAARERAQQAEFDKAEREALGGSSAPTGGAPGGGNSASGGQGKSRGLDVGVGETPGDDVAEEVAPPVEKAEAEPEVPVPPLPPTTTTSGSAAPTKDNTDWDVVPVFFGTDRQRADNAKHLAYDGVRARRLELGQALVTVPKSHQVPSIERPWALRIPYFNVTIYEEDEDPKLHFTMQEIKALSRADFLSLVRARLAKSQTFKDQAFVFVHGFNTSFENSIYRTAQIAYDLKFDGAPFLYSWPSGGGVSSYTYDRESSGQATPYLRDFMNLVINETGAKAVSVIAHSMGNQPILQVLKDLKNATPDGVIISQVILAAPDVDRDNFENIAKEILGLAKGITLYVAANDQALQFSRRFHGGVPRAGDIPARGPVVINGIDTIDVTSASTDSLGINHSGYAENNALLKDIERLIATGAAPADRHPPKFERIEQGQGAYWKYPAAP